MTSLSALQFTAEFACTCGSLIQLRTYRAVVEGLGQIVVCRHCRQPFRVYRVMDGDQVVQQGAEILPRRWVPEGVTPPPLSSYGVFAPPHEPASLPGRPDLCYKCNLPMGDHPSIKEHG